MKVKIIFDSYEQDFEDKINDFLSKSNIKAIDVKFQALDRVLGAMIIYEENKE